MNILRAAKLNANRRVLDVKYTRRLLHMVANGNVQDELRALLRETAQPVAVVTSFMPSSSSHVVSPSSSPSLPSHSRFHGATLSSFSSISMDPHPLVAFSLRIPSRMATTLSALAPSSTPSSSSTSDSLTPPTPDPQATHMVINILSSTQSSTAILFSRPDLHPYPFQNVAYTLTHEGLPVLNGAVGALSCRLVAASWKLHDLEALRGEKEDEEGEWKGEGVASELFIAEVVRVENVASVEGEEGRVPLLYHRRAYASTAPIPALGQSKS